MRTPFAEDTMTTCKAAKYIASKLSISLSGFVGFSCRTFCISDTSRNLTHTYYADLPQRTDIALHRAMFSSSIHVSNNFQSIGINVCPATLAFQE